jgi:hypothetical protein
VSGFVDIHVSQRYDGVSFPERLSIDPKMKKLTVAPFPTEPASKSKKTA